MALLGIFLILAHLVLGFYFWALVKARGRIDKSLRDSIACDDLVSALVDREFFETEAAEASDLSGKATRSTGKVWETLLSAGADYPTIIKIEMESSSRSLYIPVYTIVALAAIAFFIEFLLLPTIYAIASFVVFLAMALMPLPEPGSRRALSELAALSWLVYRFYKSDPGECAKALGKSGHLKNLFEAIAGLDPKYRNSFLAKKEHEISPAVFRHAYLDGPLELPPLEAGPASSVYGPRVQEIVNLLVLAGLSPGNYPRRHLTDPPPAAFWRRASSAANELWAWLRQNTDATAEARAAQARRVVDRAGLVPRYLRYRS
jgi:hypothetical protein